MKAEFQRPEESSWRKALSIGFGFFMGILPIWGFQLLVGIPSALALRLNRVLFITAANISIPPLIPLIIYGSYKAGAPFMGENAVDLHFSRDITLSAIWESLQQYLIGGVVLAVAMGVLGTVVTFVLLRPFRGK